MKAVKMPDDLHRELKIMAAQRGKSLQNCLWEMVRSSVKPTKPDAFTPTPSPEEFMKHLKAGKISISTVPPPLAGPCDDLPAGRGLGRPKMPEGSTIQHAAGCACGVCTGFDQTGPEEDFSQIRRR